LKKVSSDSRSPFSPVGLVQNVTINPFYNLRSIALPDGRRSWRGADIERSTIPSSSSSSSSSSSIQDLNVELVKIYDTNNMKLTLNGTCLYMKPTTALFLFELEQCVKQCFL